MTGQVPEEATVRRAQAYLDSRGSTHLFTDADTLLAQLLTAYLAQRRVVDAARRVYSETCRDAEDLLTDAERELGAALAVVSPETETE